MPIKKRNLIILAKTAEVEDINFYKTVLRESSPLFLKTVVNMFSVVSQVTDFLDQMPDSYEFSLLVHLGKKALTKGQDGDDYAAEIAAEWWGHSLKYEFTSREGTDRWQGIKVHHTNRLPDGANIDMLPINRLVELRRPEYTNGSTSQKKALSIAIQTALDKSENDIFRNYLDAKEINLTTWKGKFKESSHFTQDFKEDILLVKQKQMGMVDAAYTASSLIHENEIDYLLLAGVCGGRKKKVKMFDVIIPAKVYDFAFGSLENGEYLQRDLDAKMDEDLISYLQRPENVKRIKSGMIALMDTGHQDKEHFVRNVEIHFEVMACGPWVVKTEGFLEKLSTEKNNLIRGLEMESYSIGRLFELYKQRGIKALVVKSVMDFTDEKKGEDLQNVDTKHIAGYISYLCIRSLLPLLAEYHER